MFLDLVLHEAQYAREFCANANVAVPSPNFVAARMFEPIAEQAVKPILATAKLLG